MKKVIAKGEDFSCLRNSEGKASLLMTMEKCSRDFNNVYIIQKTSKIDLKNCDGRIDQNSSPSNLLNRENLNEYEFLQIITLWISQFGIT